MEALPEFCGLDPLKPVTVYRRSLPHWRQDGATYFVTFRLADSVPRTKVLEWRSQRATWYVAHGLTEGMSSHDWAITYQAIPAWQRDEFERRQARQVMVELDRCHGACLLNDRSNAEGVADSLHHFDGDRYRCGDFVVMPDHVHWLVLPLPGFRLEGIVGAVKRHTARRINERSGKCGSIWQRESYDRLVRDSHELVRTRRYIESNPEHGVVTSSDRTWTAEWLDSVRAMDLSS